MEAAVRATSFDGEISGHIIYDEAVDHVNGVVGFIVQVWTLPYDDNFIIVINYRV